MLNFQLVPRASSIVRRGNESLRRVKFKALIITFLPLVAALCARGAVAGTPVKCTGPNGEVVYQDTPCLKTLQKQAEDAQKTRQQAKQLQIERDKKWEALDAQRMKSPNPYGALVPPSSASQRVRDASNGNPSDVAQAEKFLAGLPPACSTSYAYASATGTVNIRTICNGSGKSMDGLVSIKNGVVTQIQ
jgi:hypothetical protein